MDTQASGVVLAVLAALVWLGGCSNTPVVPDDKTLELNALLDEIERGYAEVRQCLPAVRHIRVEIIDDRHLLFRGSARKAWLNRLRHPCSGLNRNDMLMFDLQSTRTCQGDRVSVTDPLWDSRVAGPTCVLGEFKAIPPGYANRLLDLARGR